MKSSDYVYGLTKYWWLPLISGLIFIGFGIWCLCAPVSSLSILAYIFAGCIGAVGIFNVCYGIANAANYHGWGWTVGGGIVEILFAILLFFIPSPILTWVFTYGVGIYIIFMSIYAFCDSFMISGGVSSWFWIILLFLLAAIVFAFIFILGPIGGAIIGWLYIGISFICYGVFRILLACRIKSLNKTFNNTDAA